MRTITTIAILLLAAACGGDDKTDYAPACEDVCEQGPFCTVTGGCRCVPGDECIHRDSYCGVACMGDATEPDGQACDDALRSDCEADCVARVAGAAWCPPPAPDLACSECPVSATCNDAGCECDDGTACVDG